MVDVAGGKRAADAPTGSAPTVRPPLSLATYSLHRAFLEGELDAGGMISTANELGFSAVEFVTPFLPPPTRDAGWTRSLEGLRRQADDLGTPVTLIMCEGVGDLGAARVDRRLRAVDAHARWLDGAAALGAKAVRVQLWGEATAPARTLDRAARSLETLLRSAGPGVRLLVENHSGLTADPSWVRALIRRVGSAWFGVLPDTGNFPAGTDVARVVCGLLPYAGGLSAKFYDFDESGWETTIDYAGIGEVVRWSGYEGCIGVEYEGTRLGERDGILAGRRLLEKILVMS